MKDHGIEKASNYDDDAAKIVMRCGFRLRLHISEKLLLVIRKTDQNNKQYLNSSYFSRIDIFHSTISDNCCISSLF